MQLALQMAEADAHEHESMDVARAIMMSLSCPSSGPWSFAELSRATSTAGHASTASAASTASPKCYFPNTVFRTSDGGLVLIQNLRVATRVMTSDGAWACVT